MKLHLFHSHSTLLPILLLPTLSHAQSCPSNLTPSYPFSLGAGWEARLIVQNLMKPRSLLFDSAGGLLVVQQGVGIVRLNLTDRGGTCLEVGSKYVVADEPTLNHGIAFSPDNTTLYASSASTLYSWAYTPSPLTSSPRRTLLTGMSNSDHTTRTLLISAFSPDTILVSRGSSENIDVAAQDLSSGHSQIKSFNLTLLNASEVPMDYTTAGALIGWGLRNSVGMAEHPVSGGVYSVENSADGVSRDGVDVHTDNPGEEMNFHGTLKGGDAGLKGWNYGYPDCFALWSTNVPNRGGLNVGDQFSLGDNKTVTDGFCDQQRISPRLTFQAHMAPLDIVFERTGGTAYVSFHGSWNRSPPVGYKVSSIKFSPSTGDPADPTNSTTSTTDIFSNPDLTKCPNRCFRPAGLVLDSLGRLYVSSDNTGEIWVLRKTGTGSGSNGGIASGSASGSTGGSATSTAPGAAASETGKKSAAVDVRVGRLWAWSLVLVAAALFF